MAISFVGQGTTPSAAVTPFTGTTSVTPDMPPGTVDGNIVLIFVINKPNTSTPTTPTDWTLVATVAGGEGIAGLDSGPLTITCFSRVKNSTWSTMPTIAIASANGSMAQAFTWANNTGAWSVAATTGSDATSGTAVSITGAANPGIQSGDVVVVGFGCKSDAPTFSAQAVTATGATFSAGVERSEPKTTQGNDMGGWISTHPVTAGTATAAPVATGTASTTAASGPGIIVRLREDLTIKSGSETGSVSISDVSNTSVIQTSSDTQAVSISESASVLKQVESSESSSLSISESSSVKVSYLQSFFTAINNRESKRVNIGIMGASVTEGFPATREKQIEFQLANMLRNYYPTSGNPGGIGYFGLPSVPVFNNATGYVTFAGTGATFNTSFGWGGKHATWYTFSNQSGTIIFNVGPEGPWTSFDINVLTGPSGTANGFRYSVDGGAIQTASNYSAAYQITKIRINSPVTSTVAIQAGTTSTLQIVINGLTAYKGDENKGIQVHNFGHSGYKISDWMATDGNNGLPHWREDIIAEDLDLLILGEFGANDGSVSGGNMSSASFKTAYGNFIDYIRATGFNKPILCVGAMDVSAGITFAEPWANYVQAIKETAEAKGCAFVDLRNYVPSSPNTIYGADNVHTNTSGSLSRMYAEALAEQLTDNKFDGAAVSISETTSLVKTISASDTSGLNVAESRTISGSSTSTDSSSLSIAESTTQVVSLSSSDSSSVSISETIAANKEISSSESSTISVSENTQLAISQSPSANDTSAVQITDISSLASSSTRTDTSSVSITDTSQLTNIAVRSDTAAAAITEISHVLKSLMASDSNSLVLNEDSSVLINKTLSSSDTGSLSLSEEISLYVDKVASDTSSLSLSESTSGFVEAVADDGSTFMLADPALELGIVAGSDDTSSIEITEESSLSIFNDLEVSDSASVAISESVQQDVFISTTDDAVLQVEDDGGFQRDLSGVDSTSVSVVESAFVNVFVSRSDNSNLSLIDTSSGNVAATSSDSSTINLSESFTIRQEVFSSDSNSLSVSETSSSQGINTLSANDSSAVAISDSSTAGITITRSDSGAISVSESRVLSSTSTVSDSSGLKIVENAIVSSSEQSIDATNISISETSQVSTTINSIDNGSVQISESSSFDRHIFASESGILTVVYSREVTGRPVTEDVYIYLSGPAFKQKAHLESEYSNGTMVDKDTNTKSRTEGVSITTQRLE